jgi:hydroxymethylpyrimidine/phosphomethylpyrimidine kinase
MYHKNEVVNSPLSHHALTIAGSDSCGGAGIQADLKTINSLGVEAASVVTAITAQNTLGVSQVLSLEPALILAQLQAVLTDLPIGAAKTGMLANGATIEVIARELRQHPAMALVIDPVMVATSGDRLLDPDAEKLLISELLPLARLVTPNLPEARVLTGLDDKASAQQLGEAILNLGCTAVLIKGGHAEGDRVEDLLLTQSDQHRFSHRRVTESIHGTGCALSAAITANLARGEPLEEAVASAIEWLQKMIGKTWRPQAGKLAMLPFSRACS